MKYLQLLGLIATTAIFSSCASYVTPGRQADLSTFTNASIKEAFTAKPAITFPANIAIVRVQAPGYRSESCEGYGTGAYSVVTTRDIETEKDIQDISSLPGVAGVVTLNRLLLPKDLSSDLSIRTAAAKLQADAILVYTMDTTFNDGRLLDPLTTITLGLAPNKTYKINATASAILMDTKTGYIYGALEELDSRSGVTMAWGSDKVIENGRRKAEREALDKLLSSFAPFWKTIYAKYK